MSRTGLQRQMLVVDCDLGRLRVAAPRRGVSANDALFAFDLRGGQISL